jgi:uncharacterized protein
MSQQPSGGAGGELTSNDKLIAALSYPIPIIGIVILVSDSMKSKPFMKFHAVQSIALGVVMLVLATILSITVVLACLAPVVWLVTLYPAWKTYQGEMVTLPVITDFIKKQGWA